MKIVNLMQRGEEWHEWRRKGITATDAVVILGQSPYKTPWRLWAEKTGYAIPEDLSKNPNVQRGLMYEDSARLAVERHWGDILLPVCVECSENPLLRASLDGINSAGEPVELKCPSEEVWHDVLQHGKKSEAYQLYHVQVQHQINVTGAKKGWLVFFYQGDFKLFEILPDQRLIQNIEAKAKVFWESVIKKKEPSKDPKRDVFIPKGVDVAEWIYAAEEYRLIESEVQMLKLKMDELVEKQSSSLDALKGIMGDFYTADYCGVKVTKYAVSGRIDYKKFLEHKALNFSDAELNRFRSKKEVRCRVSITDSLMPHLIVDNEVKEPVKNISMKVETLYF